MRRDLLLALLLAAAAAAVSGRCSRALERGLLEQRNEDTWFDADIPRAFAAMTGGTTDRNRGVLFHPAFGPVTRLVVLLAQSGLGMEALPAVRLTLALTAALWASLQFAFLRALGCTRVDATLFACMSLSSAAALFWLAVSESYALGSLSIVAALLLAAVAERRPVADAWHAGVTALTFAFTVTNGVFGLLAGFAHRSLKRVAATGAAGLAAVIVLVAGQVATNPESRLLPRGRREARFFQIPDVARVREVAIAATLHSMVMPGLGRLAQPRRDGGARFCLSVQQEAPGSGGDAGVVAAVCWAALLALGLFALATIRELRGPRLVLAAGLAFELTLRAFYGPETFLASLHFLPLLVGMTALATLTRARPVALVLAVLLAVSAAVNNAARFGEAVAFYGEEGRSPRIPPPAPPPRARPE